jgi:hypothetical protein
MDALKKIKHPAICIVAISNLHLNLFLSFPLFILFLLFSWFLGDKVGAQTRELVPLFAEVNATGRNTNL